MSKKFSAGLFALILAMSLSLMGCGGKATGNGAKVVDKDEAVQEQKADPAAEEAAPAPKAGTKDNPLPIGTTSKIGKWEVTPTAVVLDAAEAVANENQFNDPAPEGSQYVMITVEGTYAGEESGTLFVDIITKILGNSGNTFDTTSSFVVPPAPALYDSGETFPGGMVSGNIIIAVPTEQLNGATLIIEGWGVDRTFYALQ